MLLPLLKTKAREDVRRGRVDPQAAISSDIVAVPVPAADRGRVDARNIPGVLINKTDNDQNKVQ